MWNARRIVAAVLLDIEGTTTPISFVYGVLFPYVRTHLAEFLAAEAGSPAVGAILDQLAAERAADVAAGSQTPSSDPDMTPYVQWLMDRDRKSPGLKALQGLIWERGYRHGELRGDVFADVPDALRRWKAAGLDIAIYSSGSELAQRLLFASTPYGDLTSMLLAFFDTGVGPKQSATSYERIAAKLRRSPESILFVSDVTAELNAARQAGFQTRLSIRPGNPPQPGADEFEMVTTLHEIDPGGRFPA